MANNFVSVIPGAPTFNPISVMIASFQTMTGKESNRILINEMQHHIIDHGFQILFWQQHVVSPNQQADLTPEIMATCFQNHPHISLSDLITSTVTFAAQKN